MRCYLIFILILYFQLKFLYLIQSFQFKFDRNYIKKTRFVQKLITLGVDYSQNFHHRNLTKQNRYFMNFQNFFKVLFQSEAKFTVCWIFDLSMLIEGNFSSIKFSFLHFFSNQYWILRLKNYFKSDNENIGHFWIHFISIFSGKIAKNQIKSFRKSKMPTTFNFFNGFKLQKISRKLFEFQN